MFASYYWDGPQAPLYRFGYGLSYTTFAYANLRLSSPKISRSESLEVTVDVTNTGKRSGDETVQLYTHQQWGSASRPVRELKIFQKISLTPGESKTVHFKLTGSDVSFWSPETRRRATEDSTYDVWVGGSSAATLHGEFQIQSAAPSASN